MAKFGNSLGNNWYFLVACSNFQGGGGGGVENFSPEIR